MKLMGIDPGLAAGRLCRLFAAGLLVSGETAQTRSFANRIANRIANKVATVSADFLAIRPAISSAIQFLQVVDVRGPAPCSGPFCIARKTTRRPALTN